MRNLRKGSKGNSTLGSLECESGILPLSYRAPCSMDACIRNLDHNGHAADPLQLRHGDDGCADSFSTSV